MTFPMMCSFAENDWVLSGDCPLNIPIHAPDLFMVWSIWDQVSKLAGVSPSGLVWDRCRLLWMRRLGQDEQPARGRFVDAERAAIDVVQQAVGDYRPWMTAGYNSAFREKGDMVSIHGRQVEIMHHCYDTATTLGIAAGDLHDRQLVADVEA